MFHHVFAGSEVRTDCRTSETASALYVSRHGWDPERNQEAQSSGLFQENLLVFKLRSLCEQLGISIRETKQDAKTAVGFCSEPGTSSPAQVKLEHPLMNRKVGLLLARVPCAQDMAEALEKHLEQEGYEVLLADTSGGAVRMSGEGHPASARESTAAPTHRLPHLGTVCFAFCNASFVSSSLRCRWQIDGTDAAVRRKRSM